VSDSKSARGPGLIARLALRVARHPKAPWLVTAIGFALTLPLLGVGYFLDDWMHAWILRGNNFPGGPRGAWDLYRFADGGEGVQEATRQGFFPWWSSPELKLAFFRPIASLWRAADHALWGEAPFMPHVEASIVYGLLCYVAARTYGRAIGGVTAGVAALLFAIDDAHSMVVGWVANRYGLLAALFGLASLVLVLPREGLASRTPSAIAPSRSLASAGLFALALLSGEPAVGVLGYLIALAWFHPLGRATGLRTIAPHGVVFVAWGAAYAAGGYGAGGSSFYVDPLGSPLQFCLAAMERLPRLVVAQLGAPPAEIWSILPPSGRPLYALLTMLLAIGLVTLLVRFTRGDAAAKVLGAGALLALVPSCATNPQDRLLLVPGFGALGLVAMVFVRAWEGAELRRRTRVLVGALAVVHLVLAPLMLPLGAWNSRLSFQGFVQRGAASLPSDEGIRDQRLLILATPDLLMTNYMLVERMLGRGPAPRSGNILSIQGEGSATLLRTSDRVFVMSNPAGQNGGPFAGLYNAGSLKPGSTYETELVDIRVLESSPEGALTSFEVSLNEPVEAYRFVAWRGRGFEEVTLPEVGATLEIPGTPFFDAIQ
jgi:hypothetical protein